MKSFEDLLGLNLYDLSRTRSTSRRKVAYGPRIERYCRYGGSLNVFL